MMPQQHGDKPGPAKEREVQHSIGSDAALAALRRALETTGAVAIFRDGEIVYETDPNVLFSEPQEWLNASCCRPLPQHTAHHGGDTGHSGGNPS